LGAAALHLRTSVAEQSAIAVAVSTIKTKDTKDTKI
jgi:hypothetical protein